MIRERGKDSSRDSSDEALGTAGKVRFAAITLSTIVRVRMDAPCPETLTIFAAYFAELRMGE
jgi:hypothetical protein